MCLLMMAIDNLSLMFYELTNRYCYNVVLTVQLTITYNNLWNRILKDIK